MKFIQCRLGAKIALGINFFVLILGGLTTYICIDQANAHLEKELIRKGQEKSFIGAKMIGAIMEEAVDNEVFSIEDAFDANYIKIGNLVPPRYHTKYDIYLDKAILKLQDEFLKDESILFAVAIDRNGYLPTHNTRYQHLFTGNLEKDNSGNRTKCIFKDIVGSRAAQNTIPGFMQSYNRDTGELLWDIASPIYVKGKHWGNFRIGISPKKIDAAKMALTHELSIIAVCAFMAFFVLTFFIFNHLLKPLRELTGTIHDLSVGQSLKTAINTDRVDEIGELHIAVEDLRKSLLRILTAKNGSHIKAFEKSDSQQSEKSNKEE
jgi:HAMP domain-containing protein